MDDEDEDVRASFHGSLSRFAYVPPSLSVTVPSAPTSTSSESFLSSHTRPSRTHTNPDAAEIQPRNGIPFSNVLDADSAGDGIAPPSSLASRRKAGENQRARRGSKRRNARGILGRVDPGSDLCAGLKGIPDHVANNLDVLFCGINPGYMSAVQGHHYANPTNHFWRCLHLSGFTPRLLSASEDSTLPGTYSLGLTNLVERPSASVADLSSQEMARSAPTLLIKVARLRPHVVCFIGKGIWLHVERSLRLQADGSDEGGLIARATLKEEEMDDFTPRAPVNPDARTAKAEPGSTAFNAMSESAKRGREGSDISRGHLFAIQKAEEITDTGSSRSSYSTPVRRSGVASRASPKKAPRSTRSTFAYGLQPYKAVHDTATNNSSVRETVFCVFPSTSGRVVSHQRDDKVALFKMLRENLEHIKAGTLDAGSVRVVRLSSDT